MNTIDEHFDTVSQEFDVFGCTDPMAPRSRVVLDSSHIQIVKPYNRGEDPAGHGPEWVKDNGKLYFPGEEIYELVCEKSGYNLPPFDERPL